jgi:hypothetical protein
VIAAVVLSHIQHASAVEIATRDYASIEWLLRQPSLYVAVIPVLGIVADAACGVSGARIKMYGLVQGLIGFAGLLAFGAWAQGPAQRATLVYHALGIGIGLPILGVLGSSLDAVRRAKPKPLAALAAAVMAPLVLLLAAATGVVAAVDSLGHGNLVGFPVGGFAAAGGGSTAGPGLAPAQFGFVIAGVIVAAMAACWYWGPLLAPGGMPEIGGKLLIPVTFLGGVALGGAHLVFALVRPDDERPFVAIAGVGALLVALGAISTVAALVVRLVRRGDADDVAFEGGTLEWAGVGDAAPMADDIAVSSPYPLLDLNGAES